MTKKSTVAEIRERFDHDVERFANLDTGQSAAIDSPLMLDLIAQTAALATPGAKSVLDVGCGAGNYTLKLLQRLPNLDCTLIDLSRPMLDRAQQRISNTTTGQVTILQGDIREINLGEAQFDIILAAMVLHHLRTDAEWRSVFSAFFKALKPGGSLWIADHVSHESEIVQKVMEERWGEYLTNFRDEAYRDTVFAYVEKEDTPHNLLFQTELLRKVGFTTVDVLHKNNAFAAFGAVRSSGERWRE